MSEGDIPHFFWFPFTGMKRLKHIYLKTFSKTFIIKYIFKQSAYDFLPGHGYACGQLINVMGSPYLFL